MTMFMVLRRLISPFQEARREALRLQLVKIFLNPDLPAIELERLRSAPSSLVALVCAELLELVRGAEKQTIVAAGIRFGVPETLHQRLCSRSLGKRLAAAEALGEFNDDTTAERLHAALDDPAPAVRLAAAISLVMNGRAPPLQVLIERLSLGTKESSRFIVKLFRERAESDPSEVEALLSRDDLPLAVKVDAAEALAAQGSYDAVGPIASLVLDSDHEEADALPDLLRALGELAHPGAAGAIEHGLASDIWQIRAAAADAAGKTMLTSSIDRLAQLVHDKHWLVRFRSSEALARLGRSGHQALRGVARSTRGSPREAALIALRQAT